ncbi:putative peptidyl-prolyl cis-trans isomerase FKBP16-4, chloroplastic-like [Capsicum annuum]|nr:putative peptidyl-prolyl cis-trans isomerase FKBP16-4, chloroplastic-like [Capsicum annuum]
MNGSEMYGKKGKELIQEFAESEPGQLAAFNRQFPRLEPVTSWSHGNNFTSYSKAPLRDEKMTESLYELAQSSSHELGFGVELGLRKMNAKTPAESSGANRPTQNDPHSNNESPDNSEPPEADGSTNTELPKDDNYHGLLIHHQSLTRNKRCLMAYVYNRAEVVRKLGWTLERVLPEEIEEKLSTSEKEYFKNHAATIQSYMSALDLDLGVDMVPPKDPYIKVRVLDDIGNVVLSDQLANLARHAILFIRRTDAEQYISQGLMEELTS